MVAVAFMLSASEDKKNKDIFFTRKSHFRLIQKRCKRRANLCLVYKKVLTLTQKIDRYSYGKKEKKQNGRTIGKTTLEIG